MRHAVLLPVLLLAAACGSAPVADPGYTPEARPLTLERNEAARGPAPAPARQSDRSQSRVLAYVNDEVINYRDVLQRVGAQLAAVSTDEERAQLERTALTDILRDRILHRAAVEAGITLSRDEVDSEGRRQIRAIEKTGSFEKYLAEQGMTRREFEDRVQRDMRVQKYVRAAVGLGGPAAVQVRAITDTFVSPKEMRQFYDRNPERFQRPELARVRVLMLRAATTGSPDAARADVRRKAEAAASRLRAGEDWVPIYREAMAGSPEPDPDDGLIEFSPADRGTRNPRIEEFALTRPRGEISCFANESGTVWFVLRAEGHEAARQLAYEEVHTRIQDYLRRVKTVVATFEVELSLLEEAAISPRERADELRATLVSGRKKALQDAGQ